MNKIDILGGMLENYRKLNEEYTKKYNTFTFLVDSLLSEAEKKGKKGIITDERILLIKKSRENSEDAFNKWKRTRIEIKKLFEGSENLREPNDAENKKLLKLIRDDMDPYIDHVSSDSDICDYDENWLNTLHISIDLENFHLRHIEAGKVISDKKLPQNILKSFGAIKECYMHGLWEATIIFCRALLERTLEKKRKIVAFPFLDKEKGYLQNLIDGSDLPKKLKQEAHEKIRIPANKILHGKVFLDQTDALSSIRVAISILENLLGPNIT